MTLESEAHFPRQVRLPSHRTDTAVSFLGLGVQSWAHIYILSGTVILQGHDWFSGVPLPRLPPAAPSTGILWCPTGAMEGEAYG